MRPASLVLLFAVPVVACSEPDTRVEPAQVSWMEWPAEVLAATPFTVRLVAYGVYCVEVVRFVVTPTVDQSAVTFEPYFLTGQPRPCLALTSQDDAVAALIVRDPSFDTSAAVPGLAADYPRTYEMRAGASAYARTTLASGLPIRTFGDVTVRLDTVSTGRINAGGLAYAMRDSLGCVTLSPYSVRPAYVIENPPADTSSHWAAFVRGYIYEPAAPVCGKSKVFHLVTRN